ncbi:MULTISPECIES: 4'-phosphopantetheinyl transferase family protein [unclassified Streptomyces]|uniref:4'-phosphopantetheinyl transferase family protein n=1 Tax=unclassified Streptomyces TaxID=2593676 RepID=UPI0036B934C4
MIERILPLHAVGADTHQDGVDTLPVFPEELALVSGASAKRRAEFLAGRRCARLALRRLNHPDTPITPGADGVPRWPDGITGSITHCAGYRAAAAAPRSALAALGIDAEPNVPMERVMWNRVFQPSERVFLHRERQMLPTQDNWRQPVNWDRLIFSAKEAVYKAWRPLTGTWLGFHDVRITPTPMTAGAGRFTVRLSAVAATRIRPGTAVPVFDGRWARTDGLLVTAVAAYHHGAARYGPLRRT